MREIDQSTAANVMVLMVDSTDHVTGKTGLTLTITASKDGGAFASISPTVTERGSGWYNVALTASHTDTIGDLALHITGTAADPSDFKVLVKTAEAKDATVSKPGIAQTISSNADITAILGRVDVATSTRSAPGTAQTITAPADMALNSTVAKEATLTTKIPTALSFTGANVNAESKATAAPADMALNSTVAKETTLGNLPTLAQIEASTVLAQVADIPTVAQIAGGVWDEVLTGATHNVQNSAGKRLRTIAQMVVSSDVAQGPGTGPNQIVLAAAEPSVDGTFDPSLVAIVGGTGVGQCRMVLEYVGSTRTATVNRNWKTAPDATSEYVIYADAGGHSSNEGKIRAASSNTVQLNTLAASTDDAYIGQTVWIVSGTGDDQAKMITDYNGSTKTATIDGTWAVTPDTTSAYILLPTAAMMLGDGQAAQLAALPSASEISTEVGGASLAGGITRDFAWTAAGTVAASKKSGMIPGTATTATIRLHDDSADFMEVDLDENGNTTDVRVAN